MVVATLLSGLVGLTVIEPDFIARGIDRLYKLERDVPTEASSVPQGSVLAPAALPVGIESLVITYHFPRYTGLADAVQRDNGNLVALAGTKAEIELVPTQSFKQYR